MRYRYYSHYTYIQPDIFLKNYVVEMDNAGHITNIFPYEREIERTEFYSGLLAFVADNTVKTNQEILCEIKNMNYTEEEVEEEVIIYSEIKYKILHFEDFSKNKERGK